MVKRVVRLAADWALLARDDTKQVVSEFAKDEEKFHTTFAQAWQKVITKTHSDLVVCTGDRPSPRECSSSLRSCLKWLPVRTSTAAVSSGRVFARRDAAGQRGL